MSKKKRLGKESSLHSYSFTLIHNTRTLSTFRYTGMVPGINKAI